MIRWARGDGDVSGDRTGYAAVVRALLEQGASVDAIKIGETKTALVVACEAMRLGIGEAVTMALSEGAVDPEMSEQIAAVQALLDAGASVDVKGPGEDMTALHMAARAGTMEQVKALIRAGGCAAVTTHKGETPLGDAIAARHFEIAKLLVTALAEQPGLKAKHLASGTKAALSIGAEPVRAAAARGSAAHADLALQSEAEQGEAVALVQQARTLFDLDRHLEGREGVQQVDEAFMLLVAAAVSVGGRGVLQAQWLNRRRRCGRRAPRCRWQRCW